MDTRTGRIVEATPEQAKERGLLSVSNAEALMLKGMSRTGRRLWAAQKDPSILTAADHEALADAVAKRERKAAKRAAEAKAST